MLGNFFYIIIGIKIGEVYEILVDVFDRPFTGKLRALRHLNRTADSREREPITCINNACRSDQIRA
jgi:hypothetical protein